MQETLNRVQRVTIILNAHLKLARKYRGSPLWAFIHDICAVGSTSAIAICQECGWNPDQDGAIRLERLI